MKMKKILVIEDSIAMLEFEKESLEARFNFPVLVAKSMQEAKDILEKERDEIFVALADLILPDAPDGEIVEMLTSQSVPTIVFTGQFNEELRDFVMSKPIIDYILKTNLNNFEYAIRLVSAIYENQFIKALVVDDSEFARLKIEFSLRRLEIEVIHASNTAEAIEVLNENSDIRLVVTDYHMEANESGIDLTAQIRQNYGNEQMIVIGYSSDINKSLPVEFLKKGANDFIPYNYSEEEFTLRVLNNLEIMTHLKSARDMAIKDYLTGLYNRRHLFEASKQLFHQVKRGEFKLGVAMLDVDFFKNINDTYGHDIGDKALKHIAKIIDRHIRKSDIISRYGGEEFCILISDTNDEEMEQILDKLRQIIEQSILFVEKDDEQLELNMTVSIGFTTKSFSTLDEAIIDSDKHLYRAKLSGRNCIRF